jgi:hypothetical protein
VLGIVLVGSEHDVGDRAERVALEIDHAAVNITYNRGVPADASERTATSTTGGADGIAVSSTASVMRHGVYVEQCTCKVRCPYIVASGLFVGGQRPTHR